MVVLDLLEFDSTSSASAPAANSNVKTSQPGGAGCVGRGHVLLAKYGSTNCFYWAKVKRVYKNSSGVGLCDVEWLRPLAGAVAGKLYVLHDGHDETCHGDGLQLSLHVRWPTAAHLAAGAPPGATLATAPVRSKEMDVSDLLGDPVTPMERKAVPESISAGMAFSSPWPQIGTLSHSAPPASLNSYMDAPMRMPAQGSATVPEWHNIGSQVSPVPWSGALGPHRLPSAQNTSMPASTGMQPKLGTQQWQSSVKPVTAVSSFNELEACFASNLVTNCSGTKERSPKVKVVKGNREEASFDFISDMMSGALMDSK